MISDDSAADNLQQIIVANGETAHNEQFHILPQCFQLYLIIKPLYIENVHILANMVSKSSAADLLYVRNG